LFSLGRFEDVRVDATMDNGQVTLRYDLTPIRVLARVRFAGDLRRTGIDEGALRRALVDRYGPSPTATRAGDMARLLEGGLRERGYLHAAIPAATEPEGATDRATAVFTIEPGPRTRIGDIEVIGTPTVSRQELLNRLGLTSGAPYERDALAQRIERYVEERRR